MIKAPVITMNGFEHPRCDASPGLALEKSGIVTALPGDDMSGQYASVLVRVTANGPVTLGVSRPAISSLALSPDGRWLVVGTRTDGVFVLEAGSGTVRHHLEKPANFADWVVDVAFAPDGARFAVTSRRQAKVFFVETGALDFAVPGHALSGWVRACFTGPEALLVGSDSGALITRRDQVTKLETPHTHISQVAASSHGQRAVVFFGGVVVWCADGTRRLVRRPDVQALAFTADGDSLLIARSRGVLEGLDVHTGRRLGSTKASPHEESSSARAQQLLVDGERVWLRHARGLHAFDVASLNRPPPPTRTPRPPPDPIEWQEVCAAGDAWRAAMVRWLGLWAPTVEAAALLERVIAHASAAYPESDGSLALCFDNHSVQVNFFQWRDTGSPTPQWASHFPPHAGFDVEAGSERLDCSARLRPARSFDPAYVPFAATAHFTGLLNPTTGAVALLAEEGEPVPTDQTPGEVVLRWLADRLGEP